MPDDSSGLSLGPLIRLSPEKETEIWEEIIALRKEGNYRELQRYIELRNEVLSVYFRHTFKLALNQHFQTPWADPRDLFQWSFFILNEAFEAYVFDGRARFWSYARKCVRLRLINIVDEEERLVRLPKDNQSRAYKSRKLAREQRVEGEQPDWEEIARAIGIKYDSLRRILVRSAPKILLLGDPVEEGRKLTWAEKIADMRKNPEEELLLRDLIPVIQEALPLLTARQAFVIGYRFGIEGYGHDGEEKTQVDVAAMIGSTRMNVSLIEKKALRKLKRILRNSRFFKGGERDLKLHLQ